MLYSDSVGFTKCLMIHSCRQCTVQTTFSTYPAVKVVAVVAGTIALVVGVLAGFIAGVLVYHHINNYRSQSCKLSSHQQQQAAPVQFHNNCIWTMRIAWLPSTSKGIPMLLMYSGKHDDLSCQSVSVLQALCPLSLVLTVTDSSPSSRANFPASNV